MAIADNATNRITSAGTLENTWNFDTMARATDLGAAPQQVGIFLNGASGSDAGITLYVLDWKVE